MLTTNNHMSHCSLPTQRDLLNGLSLEEKKLIDEYSHRRSYRKNEIIYSQGDPPGDILFVESGIVRTFITLPDGKELTCGFWSSQDIVGATDIFSEAPRLLTAKAVKRSTVIAISSRDMDELLGRIPRLGRNLIRALAFKLRSRSSFSGELGTQSVLTRVSRTLVAQGRAHGKRDREGRLCLTHLSHEDLAQFVGSSRQWVSRTLSELSEMGVVECSWRTIVVVDEDRLQQLSGDFSYNA